MIRFAVVCSLLVGTLAGCDVFFPSAGPSREGTLTGIGPDGGVCDKDAQTIKNVMLAPPPCDATKPCPCGTFCSSQTGGNCVADCVDDSWCSPGYLCSGFGQCLKAGADGGAPDGATVDPTCPRSPTLLASLQTMRRDCEFDDTCPNGSYCNHATEVCAYECLADSDCGNRNSPGHVFACSCLGQCSEVAAPQVKPKGAVATVEVTPPRFWFARPTSITTPNWGTTNQRTVQVTVIAPFVTTTGSTTVGPTVTINANPGAGLKVACPVPGGTTPPPSASPCSFQPDPATFKRSGDVYRSAPVSLIVAPSMDAGFQTWATWQLRLTSDDLANTPQTVILEYSPYIDTVTPPAPVAWTPDATFAGQGTVEMTSPTGFPIRLNVKARGQQLDGRTVLVLFDETQQLSPSGKVVLINQTDGAGSQYAQTFLNPYQGNDPFLTASFSGALAQRILNVGIQQDSVTGTLTGTFDRIVDVDFHQDPSQPTVRAAFAVKKVAASAIGGCSADSDCGSGTCNLGFCSSLPAHRFVGEIQNSDQLLYFSHLTHLRMARWGTHSPYNYMALDTEQEGWWGLYLPPYTPLPTVATGVNGYRLHGPIALISGEPLADLFGRDGSVLATNVHQVAFPLLTQHDGNSPQTGPQLLQSCLADLARDRINPPNGQPDPAGASAMLADPDVFDAYTNCINLGRATWVLKDHRTFQRGLQAWLEVHSFVLREGLEEIKASQASGGIPGNSGLTPPTLEQVLGVGESGLGLVGDVFGLTYWFALETGDQIAAEVDYRQSKIVQSCLPANKDQDCNAGNGIPTMRCDPIDSTCKLLTLNELPQNEQPIGVPAYALETATSYLKVLEAFLDRTARQTYGQPASSNPANGRQAALTRFGTGMRLVWMAEQMAWALNEKAHCPAAPDGSPGPNCGVIKKRFEAARDEMNTVRARVISLGDAIQNGRNPMNISEDDVPLFFGDPTGTSSKYFAASDYLLSGWADPAVATAASSLDAARAAWIARMQSAVQDEMNQHNRQQEIDNLMSKYGAPILANCGNMQIPDSSVPGGTRLMESTEVVPYFQDGTKGLGGCFIEPSCDSSGFDEKRKLQQVLTGAFLDDDGNFLADATGSHLADTFISSELCKITYFLRPQYMPGEKFASLLASSCPGQNWSVNPTGLQRCSVTLGADQNLYFGLGAAKIPLAALYGPVSRDDIGMGHFYALATDGPGERQDVYRFYPYRTSSQYLSVPNGMTNRHVCINGMQGPSCTTVDTGARDKVTVATLFEQVALPYCSDGSNGHPELDYPAPSKVDLPARCYKGALGVAIQQANADILKVARAREVLDTGVKSLNMTKAQCTDIDKAFGLIEDQERTYDDMRRDYEDVAAIVSAVHQGGSTGTSVGMSSGSPVAGIIAGVASLGVGLYLGFMANDVADEAEKLKQLQQWFSLDQASQTCWNTFSEKRWQLATAMTDIQIAVKDLGAQQVALKDLANQNALNLQEGASVLKRELADPVGSLSHTFWVDERIEKFKTDFEWARRLTFVAMRAVEYEFQQSLPYRSEIVSAETPSDLQAVIVGLKQEQAARTINRRRPESSSIVLSLRDDVLGIGDQTNAPAGERAWSAAERFGSRLWDEQMAVRDSAGNWLGQGIPFTLNPKGVLETRCGERLWRVTATIQGDGIETTAPNAPIILQKRNTFSSQYCQGKAPTPDGAAAPLGMQVGTVHTSAQLFQPGAAVDLSDSNLMTAAILYPWFNVRRTDFYKATYQDGSSEELAGRGLYGDYVLLFPKQVLDGSFSLDRVEDVLIRFDYLSVDNLSQ